ncbi:hypothetical protein [Parvicella tangerina]|uniref:Uncharacterized protein n=1 Tax=Parvicella tangerina TaxID=2829795 RepID=A0A916NHV3_9FLAO|nr:hypothetical protein [Parvicella tangerina]CAG5082448.1 hypothetical protein CRYO30217_01919 [Parvicella tangerina]
MKFLQVLVGVLVLGILGFSVMMLYSQYQYYTIATAHQRYSFSLTNEFYLVLISTIVLTILSIPTLIYQVKVIFFKKNLRQQVVEDADLIDGDNIIISERTGPGRLLSGSAKLYAFALLTQVILLGKRSSGVLSRLNSTTDWLLLAGFALSMFVAIYFLAIDRR